MLFTSQYILLDGALIYEASLLSFFYLPEDGHIRCRNIYDVIVHKNYFTNVNCVRTVTLYTLNARIMDDVKLTDFHVYGKGLASPMWGLNLLHHCDFLSTVTKWAKEYSYETLLTVRIVWVRCPNLRALYLGCCGPLKHAKGRHRN